MIPKSMSFNGLYTLAIISTYDLPRAYIRGSIGLTQHNSTKIDNIPETCDHMSSFISLLSENVTE